MEIDFQGMKLEFFGSHLKLCCFKKNEKDPEKADLLLQGFMLFSQFEFQSCGRNQRKVFRKLNSHFFCFCQGSSSSPALKL